jgi:hypothetical protein
LLALTVLLALPGCGGDDEAGPSTTAAGTTPATSTTAATEPPTTTADPTEQSSTTTTGDTGIDHPEKDAILAAVDGAWATWIASHNPTDPDHPDFPRYFAEPALTSLREQTRQLLAQGNIAVPREDSAYRHELRLEQVDGDNATVLDCNVDDMIHPRRR